MADENGVAVRCVLQAKELLEAMDELKGKVHVIYSEEDLYEKTKGLVYPVVGILYGGLVSSSESGKETHKVGVSSDVRVTIVVLDKRRTGASELGNLELINRFDRMRKQFRNVRSPTGHVWRFGMEGATESKSGVMVMFQRWTTPAQLV